MIGYDCVLHPLSGHIAVDTMGLLNSQLLFNNIARNMANVNIAIITINPEIYEGDHSLIDTFLARMLQGPNLV